MQYDNTNSGVLFRNEKKQSDKHPDFTGNANIDGNEMWVSAWVKESKTGKKFFSMSFKPKEENSYKPQPKKDEFVNDDIPF